MARPNKVGLDYFPMDVDTDEKIELIEAKHGLVGFAIVVKLYQRIYKSGCYLEWNEEKILVFKKSVNVDIEVINEVIDDCLKYGIFDKILFVKYKILTSSGIQKRFISACDRRKYVELIKDYIIVDLSQFNVCINWKNEFINQENKPINQVFFIEINELEDYMKSDISWLEVIAMQNSFKSVEAIFPIIHEFVEVLKARGEVGKSIVDMKSHFANWYKIEKQKQGKNGVSKRNLSEKVCHADERL
jgi:hypothetical protein